MTLCLNISSRILRISLKKLGTSLFKPSLLARYAYHQSSYLPRNAVNVRSLFCQICGSVDLPLRTLSTSQVKTGKSTRKIIRPPVVFNKKAKRDCVSVWKDMTVYELASTLGKTLDELYEIFLFVDNAKYFRRARGNISSLKVIQDAVRIAGKTCVLIPNPSNALEEEETSIKDVFKSPPAPPEELEHRPPIVTIMGHVDHGKTTLLDYLRKSSIVESEFGGITQHIGAFEVLLENGRQVTFLDTPGHAAFSAMRARGANVTDIIVLVVAAEDGAMQQTRESADLAHASAIPIIVAINKIDKPGVDIKKCEESLLSIGIQPESMGGDVQVVPISALKGTNVSLLVESLATLAELLELKATTKGKSEGTIIESEVHQGKGKVATCIIRRGTLKTGSFIVADTAWAKVRSLCNSQGSRVVNGLPGTCVQVAGWKDKLPPAGAEFLEVDGEKRAKEVVSLRESELQKKKDEKAWEEIEQKREKHLKAYHEYREKKLELGFRRKMRRTTPLEKEIKEDTHPRLCIVLKGDVDGSVDAILNILDSYQSEECPLELLNFGVGTITPGDIDLAKTFNGIIYTFNVPLTSEVKYMLVEHPVPVHQHNIIYRLIEDLQDELSKRIPPLPVEEILGEAVVNEEFLVSKGKTKVPVAGCRCVSGNLKKSEFFRVIRSTETLFDGEIESLKHLKREVETIKKDVDCGLMFKDEKIRFQPGDKILCYHLKMVKRRTDWNPTGF